MAKIIYLHGFSSSVTSQKAVRIKQLLSSYDILLLDYPSHQPKQAVAMLIERIQEFVDNNLPVYLIGSSLGGYYAQYLGCELEVVKKVVLINPALQPQQTLMPYLGLHMNMVSGELFYFQKPELDDLALFDVSNTEKFADTLVLLDQGDVLIDYRFAQQRYQKSGQVICYPGGSHWFEHLDDAIPAIKAFFTQ